MRLSEYMKNEKFNKWIDRFLEEKNIDRYELFTIEKNGNKHIFEIGHIVDSIKVTSSEEQEEIKKSLIKIDFVNGDIRDYIKHLANALINTYSSFSKKEIEEETM